jgi:hypothetical protein
MLHTIRVYLVIGILCLIAVPLYIFSRLYFPLFKHLERII